METITLQEATLVKEIQWVSQQEGLESEAFLAEAVRRHLATFRQKQLAAESEAWYRLPPTERQQYTGKYVAVYDGQIIDSDVDQLALYHRVRQKLGRRTVLITEGGSHPMPVYQVRSTRSGSSKHG